MRTMKGCGDRSGPAVHRNICVVKRILTRASYMNVNVCLCETLKQVTNFIPQSTCQSVNHAHSSHIATPLRFYDDICPQKFVWLQISSPAVWGIHIIHHVPMSETAGLPLYCAPSPPSLTCLLHFIILLNGEMKDPLSLLRESASFVRHRLLKRGVWVAAVPSLNRTSVKFWEPTDKLGFWLEQW